MLRLFCFPYAGGGSQIYQRWPAFLPKEIEVFPVQLPGRGSRLRESPFRRLTELVQAIMKDLPSDRPFAFFGHSMGGMIAFELARALRRSNQPGPIHLFISACRAPQIKDMDPPLYTLPTAEFLEELRRLGGTPPQILEHAELMKILLPVIRADFELVETYEYQEEAPLDCPISVFGGLQDLEIKKTDLEDWQKSTRGRFMLSMLPGDHFFIQQESEKLLRSLMQQLPKILENT